MSRAISSSSIKHSVFASLLRKKSSRVGFAIVIAFLVMLAVGPHLTPYGPYQTSALLNNPPSYAHPLGTDYMGHDLLSQLIYGAYPSILVGVSGAFGAVLIGVLVGVPAGYFRRLEGIFTGMTDVVLTFPPLPLMILLGSLSQSTNEVITLVLVAVLWPPIARSIRSQVMSVKQNPYIEASKLSGMKDLEIIVKDIVPEILSIAVGYFVLTAASAIVLVTGLEYIGVGNPDIVSWGSIIYWGQQFGFYSGAWWWVLEPGLLITLLAIGFALIGFSVEEVMNPRLKI